MTVKRGALWRIIPGTPLYGRNRSLPARRRFMLETIDLTKKLPKPTYSKVMAELQEKLRGLQYLAKEAEVPVIICLEGWDTAGKGMVIKKLTEKLDPRMFRVIPGSPPTELEARYHFLWRYQMALPNDGEMVVFDHSWYGRVLVERVDKFTKKKQWKQAYEEINQFERWLADDGQVRSEEHTSELQSPYVI